MSSPSNDPAAPSRSHTDDSRTVDQAQLDQNIDVTRQMNGAPVNPNNLHRQQDQPAASPPAPAVAKSENTDSIPSNLSYPHFANSTSTNITTSINQSAVNANAGTNTNGGGEFGTGGGASWAQNDVDQLQDVLGSSGVDLRAEESAMYRRNLVNIPNSVEQTRNAEEERASAFYLELMPLSYRIHKIAQMNGLHVDADVLQHISLAAKIRFRNLIQSMVNASRHRQWSSHLRPPPMYAKSKSAMYHEEIEEDPSKLLSVLARVEKAQEQAARQRRLQREEQEANLANAAGRGETEDSTMADGTQNGSQQGSQSASNGQSGTLQSSTDGATGNSQEDAKRKMKKPGISTAARNMTEDKRLRLANNTAAQAMGLSAGSKAWMFGGGSLPKAANKTKSSNSGSSLPAPRFGTKAKDTQETLDESTSATQSGANGSNSFATSSINPGGWGDLAARQRHREEEEKRQMRIVNLDDALHALEMERKGGAGRGSGERVLYATRALGRPTIPTTTQGQF